MSSILQKGIVPDWQHKVYRPLPAKDHFNGPADIQNLVSGQRWVYWACRNVEGSDGHRHVTQCATVSHEIQRQEAAFGLTLDALLL